MGTPPKGLTAFTETADERLRALKLHAKNQRERGEIEAWLLAEMKKLLPTARKQARAGKPALLRLIARHVKQQGNSSTS